MKKQPKIVFILFIFTFAIIVFFNQISASLGDLNTDDKVNMSDISIIINRILGLNSNPAADVNGDGQVNILDLVSVSVIFGRQYDVDSTNPTVLSHTPGNLQAGTSYAIVGVNTDERAECRYANSSGVAFGSMSNFTKQGGIFNSLNHTGLEDDTTYFYYVKCQDETGNTNNTEYSFNFSVTTADITAPSQPTNLQAIANSSSQINLTWTASTDDFGIAGYQIFRCLGTCTPTVNIANTTGTGTNYSSTGLTASTTYTYRVAARDAAGNIGSQSASANATTQASGENSALEFPVFETMPGAVLHVFEDWSTYSTPSQIASTNRVDGGGPWTVDDASKLAFSTNDNDPWYGTKTVDIDFQDAPSTVWQRGFTLTQEGSPARYLNASSANDSLVVEWAVRQSGTAIYTGKIADWQPSSYYELGRFNFQNSYDRPGSQQAASCDVDPMCDAYFICCGSRPDIFVARQPYYEPETNWFGDQFARSDNLMHGDLGVQFYAQNRGFPADQNNPQSDEFLYNESEIVQNQWLRIVFRLTLDQPGQSYGHGRIEQWVQREGESPVKVMEYIGDVGQFDAGWAYVGSPSNQWLPDGATMHWYHLTAVFDNFAGGNTLHLGYFRMWSHPRIELS